ncbi:RNA-binding protein 25 isoform X1 [Dioscorea cayenensis subsp. rotundata]|uniref:RNA-binding protein 25 isoform X1 n=1 Tax=Dioscorea cayennensis subsp. rotundata TaxID=55577 RepID=A0AB40BEQ2_DIOCR|nr:RNA-binding protein 25 isoform X1 [Dioscorea cayenensis subsp. rotundata]XP_039125800.1 RNA-binding protein 25 isoform X1 [Dioscorea cayenensis subsp. rotundata]
MATSLPSPSSQPSDANTEKPEIQNPSINHPDSGLASENPKPIPNPLPSPVIPPPPAAPSFTPAFRPLGAPTGLPYPAFSNPGYPPPPMVQNPGIQPPGVAVSGAGAVPASVPPMRPGMYPAPPGQVPVVYGPGPNGYMAVPPPGPLAPGVMPPPGIPRYPGPYPLVRAGFPPRPGFISPLGRPPIPGIRGIPPIATPIVRPPITIVAPQEKPQTTVYVGKIAPTVDNDFLLSLLRLCGPVKSWKRAQDPTDGTPKGFGFCEFESAEGVLRGLRVLSKLSIDGQELVLNINQATREYLDRYIEKKTESEKLKGPELEIATEENKSAAAVENKEPQNPKPIEEDLDTSRDKETQESTQKFGIITDEDHDADREILEKVTSMIEERIKTKPLPPPPPMQVPADAKSNSEVPSKSRDGDSGVDAMKDVDNRNDDETTSEMKSAAELEKPEASSADKGSRHDRRGRERDRDLKREKERELERYERERERERARRERERDIKSREVERLYNERLKEWEGREREKERHRKYEKDREKEREWERRKLVMKQEDESDDEDIRRRRYRSSMYEEKRRRRKREREDDLADRLKEEEETAEAKRRAIEVQEKINSIELSAQVSIDVEKVATQDEEMVIDGMENVEEDSHQGDGIDKNGCNDEQVGSTTGSDTKQNCHVPTRKLGFGLVGSGKRAAMPSVFHEADDEDVEERKMRPLVPIDYSTDEIQAIQSATSAAQPNLVAAAEFAKRISSVNHKEEKLDVDKERNKRTSDRASQRERDRSDDGNSRLRDENKERIHKVHDRERDQEDKLKENRKLLDAKQLIDMIPKTKDELFAYQINWDVYDKHKLHERMRPWIAKKITEFLGEEEDTLVDYIVSNTKEHAQASKMLELLQSILDDEAEMFVLKMWRMLIFEIKKVETGLTGKPRG